MTRRPPGSTLFPSTTLSRSCQTTYTAPAAAASVTITASYSGDSTHATSSGTSSLTVQTPHTTSTAVAPNPATITPQSGGSLALTPTVTDSSASPTSPTGTISLGDGGGRGAFQPRHLPPASPPPSF